MRHFNIKTTLEQELNIKEQFENGATIKSLMELYGVGRGAIDGALKRQGVEQTIESYAKRRRALSDEQELEAIELYESGLSVQQVAHHYNLSSRRAIINAMKKHCVSAREHRKYYFNIHTFDTIQDEHTNYWFGFIYADGTTSTGALRIGLSPKDEKQIWKIIEFMNGDAPIRRTDIAISTEFHSVHLDKQLMDKGIIPWRGKFNLTLPHITMPQHFIRGYLDGDGCISTNEQVVFLGQVDILTWIRKTLNQECNASMNTIRQRSGIHEISWGGIHQARRIVNWMYKDATIWMKRKKDVADNWRS